MYCQLAFQQGLIRITNSCEKLRFIFEIVYSEICSRGSIFTIQLSQRYEVRNYHTFHTGGKWKYSDSRYNTIRKLI